LDIFQYQGYQETKSHAAGDFPYNTYPCTIPLDFREVPLHWHDSAELIVIKKGGADVRLDMTYLTAYEGDFILVLPGHIHGIYQHGSRRVEYENIIFSPSLLLPRQVDLTSSLIETFLQGNYDAQMLHFSPRLRWHGNASLIIEETDLLCDHRPEGYQIAVRGNLLRLFFLIVTGVKALAAEAKKEGSAAVKPQTLEKVKVIVKYVEEHFQDPIPVAEAAKMAGYSESHFMKFFKGAMGVSFTAWLDDYRLSMAARMLRLSSAAVLSIAQSCGFQNLSYFNRSFKKKYLMTPRQYRNTAAP